MRPGKLAMTVEASICFPHIRRNPRNFVRTAPLAETSTNTEKTMERVGQIRGNDGSAHGKVYKQNDESLYSSVSIVLI